MNTTSRRGMIWIELVVLIAVLVIVAFLVFPVIARARETARRASCQSSLHRIGFAINLYLQDNDNHCPPPRRHPPEPEAVDIYLGRWADAVHTYSRGRPIPPCPNRPDPAYYSYILNSYFAQAERAADIPDWAGTIIMAERQAGVAELSYPVSEKGPEMKNYIATRRHENGSNYLFADGHAKWLEFPDTMIPINLHDPLHPKLSE